MMGAGWVLNLMVAEWLIRTQAHRYRCGPLPMPEELRQAVQRPPSALW